MRHKYETRGIVLSRVPLGEANALVTLLTPELGLVRARAQGVRREGAKLAAALCTLAESSVVLVRGKEGWRIAGAVLEENWFTRMQQRNARVRAARISGLLLRLVGGEIRDARLFTLMVSLLTALSDSHESLHESAEILTALRALSVLGLDAGELPSEGEFTADMLARVGEMRAVYVARINRGIEASGL